MPGRPRRARRRHRSTKPTTPSANPARISTRLLEREHVDDEADGERRRSRRPATTASPAAAAASTAGHQGSARRSRGSVASQPAPAERTGAAWSGSRVAPRRVPAMRKRSLLVVNPSATTTTPRTRDVLIAALSRDLDVEVVTTQGRGHATEVAHKAAADGVDVVIALGGDGTINEVVNGLLADAPAERPADVRRRRSASCPAAARTSWPGRSACRATRSRRPARCSPRIRDEHDRAPIGLGRVGEPRGSRSAPAWASTPRWSRRSRRAASPVPGRRRRCGSGPRLRGVLFGTDRREPSLVVQELAGGEAVTGRLPRDRVEHRAVDLPRPACR